MAKTNTQTLVVPCGHQTDRVCCDHPLNDLGVCVASYCPVRLGLTDQGRELLEKCREAAA